MDYSKQKLCDDIPTILGYETDSLAIVAALMKECGISPKEVKALANNYIRLYGVVMKAVKTEFNHSVDSLWMRVRYPGLNNVIKEMEEIVK